MWQESAEATEEEKKKSKSVLRKLAKRQEGQKLDGHLEDQFASGRLLACIASRPGQCGRADGYVELWFMGLMRTDVWEVVLNVTGRESWFSFCEWRKQHLEIYTHLEFTVQLYS